MPFRWIWLRLVWEHGDTAYVGFTAATGGHNENQDIRTGHSRQGRRAASLRWILRSHCLSKVAPKTMLTTTPQCSQVDRDTHGLGRFNPILIDRKSCNKLVQQKFPLAQCFVYQNAGGPGVDSPVLFALTCPNSGENGTCGDLNQDFVADLGSDFTFSKAENPGFQFLAATIGPYPGWLKGSGPDGTDPCNFTEQHGATFREQPDLVVLRRGRSSGYHEGQERRWRFLLDCRLRHFRRVASRDQHHAPAFKTYQKVQRPAWRIMPAAIRTLR